eukprot:7093270-Ditylum_brightwellii.AAC.1
MKGRGFPENDKGTLFGNGSLPSSRHQPPSRPREDSMSDRLEYTSPAPASPEHSTSFGPTINCGNHCFNFDKESETDVVQRQKTLEGTINNFLSSPGNWCDGWQAWSIHMDSDYNCFDGFLSGCEGGAASNSHVPEHVEVRRILRNRACNLSARAQRINKLKEDLSPSVWDDGQNRHNFGRSRMQHTAALSSVELKNSLSFDAARLRNIGT